MLSVAQAISLEWLGRLVKNELEWKRSYYSAIFLEGQRKSMRKKKRSPSRDPNRDIPDKNDTHPTETFSLQMQDTERKALFS
jgi:hypothetical protein